MEDLAASWKRVSSTHDLKDLLEPDEPVNDAFDWKVFASGIVLLLLAVATAAAACFSLLVGKLMASSSIPILRLVQQDAYYAPLLVLAVPVTIAARIVRWGSMKLFTTN